MIWEIWFIRDDKITNRTDAIYLSDRYGKIKQQARSEERRVGKECRL